MCVCMHVYTYRRRVNINILHYSSLATAEKFVKADWCYQSSAQNVIQREAQGSSQGTFVLSKTVKTKP